MSRPPAGDATAPLQVAVAGADDAARDQLIDALRRERPGARIGAFPGAPSGLTLLCAQAHPDPLEMQLRTALAQAGVAYQVLHGPAQAQLRNALAAIDSIAVSAHPASAGGRLNSESRLHPWGCRDCGDPGCERRLFTALRDSA